jgi:hypothetical protein
VISELAFELLLFCVSGEWRMDDDDKDTTVEHKIHSWPIKMVLLRRKRLLLCR